MLNSLVENIKQTILETNEYFVNGYSKVIQNPDLGLVLDGEMPVFPADNLGNYFYLRLPNNVGFDNSTYNYIADNIKGTGLVAPVVLVAIVRDADPDKLIKNLVNTLQGLCDEIITFTQAIYIREEVIRQELQFMNPEARDKALANVNQTIVSVSFTINEPFEYSRCITNPCSCN